MLPPPTRSYNVPYRNRPAERAKLLSYQGKIFARACEHASGRSGFEHPALLGRLPRREHNFIHPIYILKR